MDPSYRHKVLDRGAAARARQQALINSYNPPRLVQQPTTEPMAAEQPPSAGALTAEWLPVERIRIDPMYQRSLSPHRVAIMAKDFDPKRALAIAVSRRVDGSLWVFDGGHRLAAAQKAGVRAILALVIPSNQQEEAQLFRELNTNQVKVPAIVKFRAGLAAGDKETVAIAAIVEQCGLSLDLNEHGRDTKPDRVAAVAALQRFYRRTKPGQPGPIGANPARLVDVLTFVKAAWPGKQGNTMEQVLRGVDIVLRHEAQPDRRRLLDKAAALDPVQLYHDGKAVAYTLQTGIATGIANVLIKAYNENRKAGFRIPMIVDNPENKQRAMDDR